MRIKKLFTLVLLLSVSTTTMSRTTVPYSSLNVAQVRTAQSSSGSLFDGVLELVKDKGTSLIKDNLPTVGDYLCAKVFDYIGIDYSDSYTKSIREVNDKLISIHSDLKELIKSQTLNKSEKTISDFFNIVDVFSNAVHPIYMGYNELMRSEKDGLSSSEATSKETSFYNNNFKNMIFGNGTSTGSLYEQLASLLSCIVEPNKTSRNTLMEHYVITYEHRWAFNSQSFAPKREFLSYVTTNALEGLMLYTFQYLKEKELFQNDTAQLAVLEGRWNVIKAKSNAAFEYLQKEINALDNEEKENMNKNMIIHYATGKKLSKKLYIGGVLVKSTSHFTYAYSSRTTRQGNMRYVQVKTLNARKFANYIQKDFASYKKNYRKSNNTNLSDFLKNAGFQCDNWNNQGLYRGQNFRHKGVKITNEEWNFNVEYTDQNGNAKTSYYGGVKQKVFGDPKYNYANVSKWNFMAFVDVDGMLINENGYEAIYGDNGNTIVDSVYGFIRSGINNNPSGTEGKVW